MQLQQGKCSLASPSLSAQDLLVGLLGTIPERSAGRLEPSTGFPAVSSRHGAWTSCRILTLPCGTVGLVSAFWMAGSGKADMQHRRLLELGVPVLPLTLLLLRFRLTCSLTQRGLVIEHHETGPQKTAANLMGLRHFEDLLEEMLQVAGQVAAGRLATSSRSWAQGLHAHLQRERQRLSKLQLHIFYIGGRELVEAHSAQDHVQQMNVDSKSWQEVAQLPGCTLGCYCGCSARRDSCDGWLCRWPRPGLGRQFRSNPHSLEKAVTTPAHMSPIYVCRSCARRAGVHSWWDEFWA